MKKNTPWIVRTHYRMRTAAFAMVFAATALQIHDQGYSPVHWLFFIAVLLVYPHLQYLHSSRSSDPYATEMRNLWTDSLLLGVFVATVQFSDWLSFSAAMGTLSNNAANKGRRGIRSALGALLLGALLGGYLNDFRFTPQTGGIATLACILGLGAYLLLMNNIGFSRNQQLRQIREQLKESEHTAASANASKTRFLASASHDLRQPIHAAALFINSLKRAAPNTHQTEIIGYLEHSIQSIQDLLDRLLDISKLESGVIECRKESISIHQLLRRLESEFAMQAAAKNLRMRIRYPKADQFVQGDFYLSTMVLRNLLSNAVGYTERGGILVAVRRQGGLLRLQVWDTGIGIAQDQLARIYDEFYQVDNAHRDSSRGLGLGLAIAYRAALLMSAPLRCTSRPGRGSMFELQLPHDNSQYRAQAPAPECPPAAHPFFSGKRVVLVEDEVMAAKALSNWLCEQDCFVNHFHGAEAALNDPHLLGADVYISDFRLPGKIDGLAFLDAVGSRSHRPFHALLITGDTSPEFIAKAKLSQWPVMFKPVHPEALSEALAAQTPQISCAT